MCLPLSTGAGANYQSNRGRQAKKKPAQNKLNSNSEGSQALIN